MIYLLNLNPWVIGNHCAVRIYSFRLEMIWESPCSGKGFGFSVQQAWHPTYFLNMKTKLGLGFCMCREHILLKGEPNLTVYFFSLLKLTKRGKLPGRKAWWFWKVDVSVKKMKKDQHEGTIPVKVKTNSNHSQADWLVGTEVRCFCRKLGEEGTDCSFQLVWCGSKGTNL